MNLEVTIDVSPPHVAVHWPAQGFREGYNVRIEPLNPTNDPDAYAAGHRFELLDDQYPDRLLYATFDEAVAALFRTVAETIQEGAAQDG